MSTAVPAPGEPGSSLSTATGTFLHLKAHRQRDGRPVLRPVSLSVRSWTSADAQEHPGAPAVELPNPYEGAVARAQDADTFAQERVRELHEHLLRQDPEQFLWRRLTAPALAQFSYQPELLRQAWNPEAGVLLDQVVYGAVLDLVQASAAVRRTAWSRYWRASQAVTLTKNSGHGMTASPTKPPRWWFGDAIPPQELWQLAVDRLQVIDTEAALIAHLKMLMDFSAHSTRTLHRELTKRCKRAPSHTTIANWLNANTIPRLFTEDILIAMVGVLAEDLGTGSEVHMPAVIDAHKRAYRALIVARHADQLHAGPVPRALAALTTQENALAQEDPARQPIQLAREALLRAIAQTDAS